MLKSNPSSSNLVNSNIYQLEEYRIEIFRANIIRALQFLLGAFLLIGLYLTGKLNKSVALTGLMALVLVDLWMVDKDYFNNETVPNTTKNAANRYVQYQKDIDKKSPYTPSPVDQAILQKELKLNPAITTEIEKGISDLRKENPLKN